MEKVLIWKYESGSLDQELVWISMWKKDQSYCKSFLFYALKFPFWKYFWDNQSWSERKITSCNENERIFKHFVRFTRKKNFPTRLPIIWKLGKIISDEMIH